jgi:hypothetical protein
MHVSSCQDRAPHSLLASLTGECVDMVVSGVNGSGSPAMTAGVLISLPSTQTTFMPHQAIHHGRTSGRMSKRARRFCVTSTILPSVRASACSGSRSSP